MSSPTCLMADNFSESKKDDLEKVLNSIRMSLETLHGKWFATRVQFQAVGPVYLSHFMSSWKVEVEKLEVVPTVELWYDSTIGYLNFNTLKIDKQEYIVDASTPSQFLNLLSDVKSRLFNVAALKRETSSFIDKVAQGLTKDKARREELYDKHSVGFLCPEWLQSIVEASESRGTDPNAMMYQSVTRAMLRDFHGE